ncbi:GNAT family N-acetyltransferase [bacterium]|nr:GNAT family N-acetyltransferase [bacterium]
MKSSLWTIRNYRSQDFKNLVEFLNSTSTLYSGWGNSSPNYLKKRLSRPHYSPYLNLFLVYKEGKIVGYADVIPEVKIKRAVLDFFISSSHRFQKLGYQLLKKAQERARQFRVRVFHTFTPETDFWVKNFLSEQGYSPVRTFLELEKDISIMKNPPHSSSSLVLSFFRKGEEPLLAELQNKCFKGSWGFSPNSVQEIKYYLRFTEISIEEVIKGMVKHNTAGYCWPHVIHSSFGGSGPSRGRIHMLGIDPRFQGKGFSRDLLGAGLNFLDQKGAEKVDLTVSRENKAACSLYFSSGFNQKSKVLWYEKRIE